MIYVILGTDLKTREKAKDALAKIGNTTMHIYSEQISALEPLISASSLFGEKVIVNILQVMEVASSKEELLRLLSEMKKSTNIFIIDELFADVHSVNKLTKYAEKVFDGREEKKKVDIFTLCNHFARRDKKEAWLEWLRIKDNVEGEAVSGLLWWKFQTVWSDARDGKPTKFTLRECETIGERIVLAGLLSHEGKIDLKTELESIILSV